MRDRLIQLTRPVFRRLGLPADWGLILAGAALGTLTGLGAVGFAITLHEIEHFVQHQQQMRWWMVVLLPVVGLTLTGLLVHFFAAEAKGHGVPQVMSALIKRGGRIPLRTGWVKVIASLLTVGSGGSAGVEGPIVQIGAVAGSVSGQRLGVNRQHMQTLVGCGAAAGIASIFNAPIAGVLFVLEILLRDFSLRTFTPIVLASVFSAVTTQAFQGTNDAIFATDATLHAYQFRVVELPSYIGLGVVCGLVAVAFARLLHFGEDVFEKWTIHPVARTAVGGLLLGLIGLGFLWLTAPEGVEGGGVPAFFGGGYQTITSLLSPESYLTDAAPGGLPVTVWLLLALLVFKGVATTVTLASGGSGGVFAPGLFLGAVAGGVLGVALERTGLMPEGSTPASYALVGMAAVIAAMMHAPLTAILMLYELTRNEYVLLPIMLAAVVALVIAQVVDRDSIYTAKLRRQGVIVGAARDHVLLRGIPVASVSPTALPPEPIYASDPLSKLITLHAHHHVPDFPIVNAEGQYLGMVTGRDIRTALIDREAIPLLLVAELVRDDLPTIDASEHLDTVMDKFSDHDVASLCLVGGDGRPVSLVSRSGVIRCYQSALETE